VLDVPVAYGEDSERARALIERVAAEIAADPEWSEHVLEPAEVWGVEDVQANAYVLRLVVKTEPLQQWPLARELRERIMRTFTAEGVPISAS
jgi:moderate conductance mechanosensitive channel